MRRAAAAALFATLAVAAGPAAPSAAQDLAARLRAAPAGDVMFHFPARLGVCGDGDVIVRQRPGSGNSISFTGDLSSRDGRDFDHLDAWCRPGPVRVTARRDGTEITALTLEIGATDAAAYDVGEVSAEDAVAWLVGDVARRSGRRVAGRALHAASLAAAEAWPAMLELARDPGIEEKVRTSAIHWLAVDASDRLLAGVPALDEETELRRQAVFALSRRKDDVSRTALRDLTRSGTEPAIRAAAVYWIGVSEDEEALPLLESVLRGR